MQDEILARLENELLRAGREPIAVYTGLFLQADEDNKNIYLRRFEKGEIDLDFTALYPRLSNEHKRWVADSWVNGKLHRDSRNFFTPHPTFWPEYIIEKYFPQMEPDQHHFPGHNDYDIREAQVLVIMNGNYELTFTAIASWFGKFEGPQEGEIHLELECILRDKEPFDYGIGFQVQTRVGDRNHESRLYLTCGTYSGKVGVNTLTPSMHRVGNYTQEQPLETVTQFLEDAKDLSKNGLTPSDSSQAP